MPYTMRKVNNKHCYRVFNKKSRKIFSKCTNKKNAIKQLRLLRAIIYNKKFVLNSKRTRKNR